MKRLFLVLLAVALVLSGCVQRSDEPDPLWAKARAVPRVEAQPEGEELKKGAEKTEQSSTEKKGSTQAPTAKNGARPVAQQKPPAKTTAPQGSVQQPSTVGNSVYQVTQRKPATITAPRQGSAQELSAEFKSRFRRELLGYINDARKGAGLKPLEPYEEADRFADARAADMIRRQYFDHTTPDGKSFSAMLSEAGLVGKRFRGGGENIFWEGSGDCSGIARMAHEAFMDSAGHRANILKPEYTHVGLGLARTAPDAATVGTIVVEVFLGYAVEQRM